MSGKLKIQDFIKTWGSSAEKGVAFECSISGDGDIEGGKIVLGGGHTLAFADGEEAEPGTLWRVFGPALAPSHTVASSPDECMETAERMRSIADGWEAAGRIWRRVFSAPAPVEPETRDF